MSEEAKRELVSRWLRKARHDMASRNTVTGRVVKFWLPMVVLALSPAVAHADAGTPLIWASAFHLVLGNAVIGIAEGLVLAMLFRQKRGTCVAVMILANYFSAWAGGVFISSYIVRNLDLDLHNAPRWLWRMVAITYFLTLLLEWPFVALCLRKCDGRFAKSIWGSLVVQSASYVVLFGWYWAASGTSLYSDLTIVQPSAISLPKGAMLYYIDDDGDIYACDIDQGQTRKVCELESLESGNRLLLRQSCSTPDRWDLAVGSKTQDPSPSDRIVFAGLKCIAADPPSVGIRPGGEVPRFRGDTSTWNFQFGWMAGRLDGRNARDGRNISVSLETPFVTWPVRCPTQFPGGQVVFQLGRNQICVLDPDQRKIALIAKGRWPVVTLNDSQK